MRFVAFDAEDQTAEAERFIYDRTVMTAKQIKQWTGVDVTEAK